MAATPKLKVFNSKGEYVASCVHAEDAAAIVNLYGNGAQIRNGHSKRDIVWDEGRETHPAGESYDLVAAIVADRIAKGRA